MGRNKISIKLVGLPRLFSLRRRSDHQLGLYLAPILFESFFPHAFKLYKAFFLNAISYHFLSLNADLSSLKPDFFRLILSLFLLPRIGSGKTHPRDVNTCQFFPFPLLFPQNTRFALPISVINQLYRQFNRD